MKIKYIPNTYSMFDDHALINKLERMALKGWQLQKISRYLLSFRKAEPQALHYAIGFFPDAEAEDPTMSENQLSYIDLCSASGWELAAAYGPMQVFQSAAANPVPLETDDALKLKAIDGGIGKTHILLHLTLILIPLFWLTRFRFESGYLTSAPWHPVWIAAVSFTMIRSLLELSFYFYWFFKGSRQVELGLPLPSTHAGIRRAGFWLWVTLWLVVFIARGGFRFLALYAVIRLIINGADLFSIRIGKKHLKNAASVRRFAGLCAVVLLALIYLGSNELRMLSFTPPYTDGRIVVQRSDSLPVTLEELDEAVPNIIYSCIASTENSLLMDHQTFTQAPMGIDPDLPVLKISIRQARIDTLNTFHYKSILNHYSAIGTVDEQNRCGAIRSMCYADPESDSKTYALLYSDRVLYLYDLYDMTDKQVDLIVDRLLEV